MKLYGIDQRELMTVSRIERSGSQLVVKAKVFGTMPMTVTLSPADVREALRLLRFRGLLFLMSMPFRRSTPPPKEGA
jgi:hypothetical protein